MNVTTGQVIAERIGTNDSAAFTSFLAMLHRMIPPHLRIHLIMDNGSSQTSRATRDWLAVHPRFTVTCTPKHASWLNMHACPDNWWDWYAAYLDARAWEDARGGIAGRGPLHGGSPARCGPVRSIAAHPEARDRLPQGS